MHKRVGVIMLGMLLPHHGSGFENVRIFVRIFLLVFSLVCHDCFSFLSSLSSVPDLVRFFPLCEFLFSMFQYFRRLLVIKYSCRA